jgi:hypothetical protein
VARSPQPISEYTANMILKAWRDELELFADDWKYVV